RVGLGRRRVVLVVGLAPVVAHGLGRAAAVLDDLHPVAELDVAVVALRHGDGLAVVLLHHDLDAATRRLAVEDDTADAASHRAQHAADQAAGEATAARGADGDAAQPAEQAADHRAVARAAAAPDAGVVDGHD